MCGRYTLRTLPKELARQFGVKVSGLKPSYNIAPTQQVAVVRLDKEGEKREFVRVRWGLVPFWADDPKTGYSLINARAETVATKRSYKRSFQQRRCLILADGFYEWKKTGDKKQPYFIHMKSDEPFAFAGIWEEWQGEAGEIESCAMIVTNANELMKPVHERMPVILHPDDYDVWLDPEMQDTEKLQELLRAYPSEEMEMYPVRTVVNNPRNDAKDCLEPAESD